MAHLSKGETYTDLAAGFAIGAITVFRYVREALDVLAALAPTLTDAMHVAANKAFVILDDPVCRSTVSSVNPLVHMPCRIGARKPPRAAKAGSVCSGLRSPVSR